MFSSIPSPGLRTIRLAFAIGLPAITTAALAEVAVPTPLNAKGQVELVLEGHRFTPAEIRLPADRPAAILLRNADATADEFDSKDLRVEKVVGGGAQGVIRLPPLKPGRYTFMGEFHADTAQGVVVVE
ncbi:cupredoxin domain-containing protein [Aureimonas sp. AU12]|uniref:cupredoxin domain-containing protein n=1 Tax=Aureimonas sp. AU12 TaxID=1638161 RepID=UPI0007845CD8|nr:cupredoxin domain-containing protein [Aureimonas sp. AU12]